MFPVFQVKLSESFQDLSRHVMKGSGATASPLVQKNGGLDDGYKPKCEFTSNLTVSSYPPLYLTSTNAPFSVHLWLRMFMSPFLALLIIESTSMVVIYLLLEHVYYRRVIKTLSQVVVLSTTAVFS